MLETPDHAQVRVAAPVVFAGFLLAALFLHWMIPLAVLWPLGTRGAAAAALALGLLFGFSALFRLRQRHTAVSPHQSTSSLVTDGPYGLSRNPIYLGFMLIYIGFTLLAGTLWGLLLAPVLMVIVNRNVIAAEERYLQSKFHDRFATYKSRVRQWL